MIHYQIHFESKWFICCPLACPFACLLACPLACVLACLFARLAACLLAGVAHVCGTLVSARASLAIGQMCLEVFRVTLAATPSFGVKQHGP